MQAGQPINFTNGTAAQRKVSNISWLDSTGSNDFQIHSGNEFKVSTGSSSSDVRLMLDSLGKLTINGDVDIQGVLNTVTGTETVFEDTILTLNKNSGGVANSSAALVSGIQINRTDGLVSFTWEDTNDNWLLTGGPLNMGGSLKITGLADPTDSADAANKKYVNDEDAALLAQVLQLSGGTMTGALDMNSQSISNLAAPSVAADAATKQYVDDEVAGATMADSDILTGLLNVDGAGSTLDADLLDGLEADVFMKHDGTVAMSGALDMGNNDISNANNIIATNILIGANQVLHAGNLPITANTVDGDTIYTFAALA